MSPGEVRAEVIDSEAALASVVEEWDRLAVACRRPYCSPAWQLSWWRHAAPRGSGLRVVVVRDGAGEFAIAPFYVEGPGGRHRLLASPICARTVPLAVPGREAEAATAIAVALAGARPRPGLIQFDGIEAGSPWPELLSGAWPTRRPTLIELGRETAPVVELTAASYDEWLGSRSKNFRQQMRRRRRALEEMGARFRLTAADDLERDIAELERLHFGRRGDRPSDAFGAGIPQMLAEAGRELIEHDRFRLWSIATVTTTVSAQLFLEAGGELAFWNGGFDDAYRDQSPGIQAILLAVADGVELGCERLELGAGDQPYKLRMTDETDELRSVALAAGGLPAARAKLGLAAARARRALGGIAPEGLKRRLRGTPR